MAKGINIVKYRGLKARRGDKVVLHLTDKKGRKLHVRFPWSLWDQLVRDITNPLNERKCKYKKCFYYEPDAKHFCCDACASDDHDSKK